MKISWQNLEKFLATSYDFLATSHDFLATSHDFLASPHHFLANIAKVPGKPTEKFLASSVGATRLQPYSTVQYSTVQYSTVEYSIVQ